MPGFDGTGPRGMGPMTGGGRGFCSPWGRGAAMRAGAIPPYPGAAYAPYTGYGAGAYPYGGAYYRPPYGYPYGATPAPGAPPATPGASFAPGMAPEQELDFLKNQAQMIGNQLGQIERRIQELENG